MYFRDIVGQDVIKDELRYSFAQGLIPHARLFVGDDGMGALGLAYAYARYINCGAPTAQDACGVCPSCRRYDDWASQDLLFLFPIVNVGSRNICEDELPAWRNFLAQGAHTLYADWLALQGGDAKRLSIFTREGERLMQRLSYQIAEAKYRIILVWLPERMQEALGNKLLKLTEEPPEQTLILMVSQDERNVLPTLRSRMQSLHLRPVTEERLAEALRGLSPHAGDNQLSEAAHLARGNYRKARDLYLERNDNAASQLQRLKRIFRATVDAQPHLNKPLIEEIAKLSREEQIDLLTYMAYFFREIFAMQLDTPSFLYLTGAEIPVAKYLKACITPPTLGQIHHELDLAVRHIGQNVNSKMVFFDLILRLTSILAKEYRRVGIR